MVKVYATNTCVGNGNLREEKNQVK